MSKKSPQLRFEGFTDDWEERKLGDYSENTFGGGTPKTGIDEYWTGDIPWIQSSDLKKEQLYNVQPSKFITDDAVKNSATKLVPKNSIAIVTRVGVGKLALLPFEYATSQDFLSLSNLKVDKWFGIYSTYTMLQKELNNIQGTSIKGITKPELLKKKMRTPSLIDEQSKIGTFFKQLDDIIALHQRKLDLLKEQKKGYLQKMFPKNGAKVPELRFAGFADDWEERKLGDLLKEFSIKSKIEDEHKVLSSTNSGMEFREGRVSGTSNLGYKIIKNGDLVLSPQNLWLGNININNIGKGLVSPSYKTFEFINIDSSFINPQLRTQKMLEEYKNSSTQGASVVRRNLEIDSFYQIKIFVPTISEQEKIGSFFKQLDDTIALHQRKLDLLKEQKKGFLQTMFAK